MVSTTHFLIGNQVHTCEYLYHTKVLQKINIFIGFVNYNFKKAYYIKFRGKTNF